MAQTKDPTQYQLSVDTQTLAAILRNTAAGQIVPYTRLSTAINRDVMRQARYVMDSARRIVLRDNGIAFGAVTGVGLRNLTDAERVATGHYTIRSMRNKARKGQRIVTAVDYSNLTPNKKTEHNTHLSIFGALMHATTYQSQLKLQAVIAENSAVIAAKSALLALTS